MIKTFFFFFFQGFDICQSKQQKVFNLVEEGFKGTIESTPSYNTSKSLKLLQPLAG